MYLHSIIIIIMIFLLFNRFAIISNIHSFVNNKQLNNTSFFFNIVCYFMLIFKNYVNQLLIIIVWVLQLVKIKITLLKIIKIVTISGLLKHREIRFSLNVNNLLFIVVELIKSVYIRNKSVITTNIIHKVVVLLLVCIISIQQTYFLHVRSLLSYKSTIINKSMFIYDTTYLVIRDNLRWRYKINLNFVNNNLLIKYY